MSVIALALALIGCNTGRPNKDRAVTSLQDARDQLARTTVAVDKTQAALTGLSQSQDIKAGHDTLASASKELAAEAEKTAALATALREQSRAHIARWELEMDEVQGAPIHSDAAQRRAAVSANFKGIRESAEAARHSYARYAGLLNDVQTALVNDMTPAGVSLADKAIKAAFEEGQTLRKHLDNVTVKVDAVFEGQSNPRTTPAATP